LNVNGDRIKSIDLYFFFCIYYFLQVHTLQQARKNKQQATSNMQHTTHSKQQAIFYSQRKTTNTQETTSNAQQISNIRNSQMKYT